MRVVVVAVSLAVVVVAVVGSLAVPSFGIVVMVAVSFIAFPSRKP